MTSVVQPRLIPQPPTLTDRQQQAWQLVRETAGGVTAEHVGANWHAVRGRHSADTPCMFCEQEGRSILTSVALKRLVVRRRTGLYEPRDAAHRPPSGPTPGEAIPF